jgi:hypothetical protein
MVLAARKLAAIRYSADDGDDIPSPLGKVDVGRNWTAPHTRGSIGKSLHNILGSTCFDNVGIIKNWNTVDSPLTDA